METNIFITLGEYLSSKEFEWAAVDAWPGLKEALHCMVCFAAVGGACMEDDLAVQGTCFWVPDKEIIMFFTYFSKWNINSDVRILITES